MWYRDGEERNLPWPKRSAGTRIPCGVSSRALSRPRLPPQALEVTPALLRQAVQPYDVRIPPGRVDERRVGGGVRPEQAEDDRRRSLGGQSEPEHRLARLAFDVDGRGSVQPLDRLEHDELDLLASQPAAQTRIRTHVRTLAFSQPSVSSTWAAWPAGLMPRIALATLPSASMTNVERSTPSYLRP